ncbi:MAG: hypothetical protein U0798_15350 [Gemmataceae bacterium]
MIETLYRLKPLEWHYRDPHGSRSYSKCQTIFGQFVIFHGVDFDEITLEYLTNAGVKHDGFDSLDAAKLSAERIVAERVAEFMEVVR